MEMRVMLQVWMLVPGTRARRVLLLLLLISLLLASQIVTHHARPVSEVEVSEPPDPTVVEHQAGGEAEGAKTPAPSPTPNTDDWKASGKEDPRNAILEGLSQLQTKELQKVQRFLDATNNPAAVPTTRIEHALQTLKVSMMEEVSGRKYWSIMEAVHNARPLSSQPRPKTLKVVIATTWRSGSTFLEELLASHSAVYNHYEPLLQFGLRQIRDGQDAVEAQKIIHDLLSCRYSGHEEYMKTAQNIKEMISRNVQLWNTCSIKDWGDALCFNEVFLTGACELFPWATMKIVRLRLKFLRPILEDSKLNAHIVYLVRDPRGVINSRTDTVNWCNTPDCSNPETLCSDMEADLTAALQLQEEFPGKIYILRYEDMSLNPANKTRELLDYIGLDFEPKMEEFLDSHTTKNLDKPWSTSRESKTRVTYWVSRLSSIKLKAVQEACGPVMKRFGYLPITSKKNITVDKILGPMAL
ncbi:carbohydrate sulfotransferase 1 [Procambarus clarkii]|uniref:carbohydrate sulfotransferase 1 n=1 Tax=Procambarus clarkii TaxID=6728 RepID=UPI001E67031C|nr:carbohydrate sulfotransferase 1-like [Procambarus clarkii]